MFKDAKVRDKVWSIANGWGVIEAIHEGEGYIYSVRVRFDNRRCEIFTREGESDQGDANPSLFWNEIKFEIPPRPKRKVKKTLEGWVNIYPLGPSDGFHTSREDADNWAGAERIACVELSGSYEVDEE